MQKPEFNQDNKWIINRKHFQDYHFDSEIYNYFSGSDLISVEKILKQLSSYKKEELKFLYFDITSKEDLEFVLISPTKEYKQYLIEMEKYKIWEAEQKIKELEQE